MDTNNRVSATFLCDSPVVRVCVTLHESSAETMPTCFIRDTIKYMIVSLVKCTYHWYMIAIILWWPGSTTRPESIIRE